MLGVKTRNTEKRTPIKAKFEYIFKANLYFFPMFPHKSIPNPPNKPGIRVHTWISFFLILKIIYLLSVCTCVHLHLNMF